MCFKIYHIIKEYYNEFFDKRSQFTFLLQPRDKVRLSLFFMQNQHAAYSLTITMMESERKRQGRRRCVGAVLHVSHT